VAVKVEMRVLEDQAPTRQQRRKISYMAVVVVEPIME
jgi:hypothetical protein